MSKTTRLEETAKDDPEVPPAEEFNIFGFVLLVLLFLYAVVSLLALVVSAYGAINAWTLYPGRPYWGSVLWPVGAVGLLTPGLMELDRVTEVERSPLVFPKALAGYGITGVGYLVGMVLNVYPLGVAGLVGTVAFGVLSVVYLWQRGEMNRDVEKVR